MNVYEIVTSKIIEKLERGTIPWVRPWSACRARNWQTGRYYSGINTMLLQTGEYLTFNQVRVAGGHVKKGESAEQIFFFKMCQVEDDKKSAGDSGEEAGSKSVPFLRYYNVFEVSQCEGISRKFDVEHLENFVPDEEAERIIAGYPNGPTVEHKGLSSFYRAADDLVVTPLREDFFSEAEYYTTMFHELSHSTGHVSRLARKEICRHTGFGSQPYGKEELVAEMSAAMLCARCHMEMALENSAAYIQNWKNVIKADTKMVMFAASQAQKAADYIAGKLEDGTEVKEPETVTAAEARALVAEARIA